MPHPNASLFSSESAKSLKNGINAWTDVYFRRAAEIAKKFGDEQVTYAVFLRRPSLAALWFVEDWLAKTAKCLNLSVSLERKCAEGGWVGAGEVLFYLTGSFRDLAPLETFILQKTGAPCVAAYNAFQIACSLPEVPFLAMDARHCAGQDMQELMAYAASVGSKAAQARGAKGFIGNANDVTAHFFGNKKGFGSMPHALVGYAGSTLRAAEMFHETFPEEKLTVLVDYFGLELDDALAVCARFPELARAGKLAIRLDTHGGRFLQGLDTQSSYAVIERHAPQTIRRYRSEKELQHLLGTGVSAAAIWKMRDVLDEGGYPSVQIVASSGFGLGKCQVMKEAEAPIGMVGTGSFLPEKWSETYATADIIAYGKEQRVKKGREFLFPSAKRRPS